MHILGPAGVSPAGSQQSPGRFSATKPKSKAKGRSERQGTAGRGKSIPLKVLKNLNHVKIKCFITFFFARRVTALHASRRQQDPREALGAGGRFFPLKRSELGNNSASKSRSVLTPAQTEAVRLPALA